MSKETSVHLLLVQVQHRQKLPKLPSQCYSNPNWAIQAATKKHSEQYAFHTASNMSIIVTMPYYKLGCKI